MQKQTLQVSGRIKPWIGRSVLVGLALLAAGCSQQPAQPLAQTVCPTERPEMCTMIYQPVCALVDSAAGPIWETRASGCSACGDAEVVGFNAGACAE